MQQIVSLQNIYRKHSGDTFYNAQGLEYKSLFAQSHAELKDILIFSEAILGHVILHYCIVNNSLGAITEYSIKAHCYFIIKSDSDTLDFLFLYILLKMSRFIYEGLNN